MEQDLVHSVPAASAPAGSSGGTLKPHFSGKRIIALAFLTVNIATGLTYGSFGPLVIPMTERFDARVSTVSLGMSLIVMTSGLLALVIGALVNRYSIRSIMTTGALLASGGHAALAFCTSIGGALACYGLMIGPGIALLGFLPSYTLVSRWYVQGQGRAFGIVGLPVMATIMPMVTAALLPQLGFKGVVLAIAAAYLLALPVVRLIIDRPEDVGQQPHGQLDEIISTSDDAPRLTLLRVLKDPTFILIAIGSGLTVAPQTAKNVLLIPIVTERGFDVAFAAMLLSIAAGTAMLGSLIFGTLADRIGAASTLIIAVILQATTWVVLAIPAGYTFLILDAILMGASLGGFVAPKSVLISTIYGTRNYATVMGVSGFVTLPFLFGMPPLMGLIREATGSYVPAILLQIGALGIAAICFILVRWRQARMAISQQRSTNRAMSDMSQARART